jgi:hypothetical protein
MKRGVMTLLSLAIAVTAIAADRPATVPRHKWFLNGKGYKEAIELQKQTGADILVYFRRTYPSDQKGLCGWWEKRGLAQPEVQKIVDDYIKVRFDFPLSRDDQKLADDWKINKCPVLVVVQTNGWRERAAVFDWPGGRPELKSPHDIVQSILNASAPSSMQRRWPAGPDGDRPAVKP